MSEFEQDSWEDRYRATTAVWSGNANMQLVAEAAALTPGTALDVGCGEGADVLWLADLGWRVTAVDFSTVALDRGAERARERGVGDRIDWVHADVRTWGPDGQFDLVSAQYMHLPAADREPLFDRLAAAVAPGGTLLLVGHMVGDLGDHHGHGPEMFFTAEQVAATLESGRWEIVVATSRPRPDNLAHDRPVEDAVLRARRLG